MEKIAISIEGIPGLIDSGLKGEFHGQAGSTLGFLVSQFLYLAFIIAGFLMFFWLVWGIFQYIYAGGNKEALASARARIMWAIVGFIIVIAAFLVSSYAREIFKDVLDPFNRLQQITKPP